MWLRRINKHRHHCAASVGYDVSTTPVDKVSVPCKAIALIEFIAYRCGQAFSPPVDPSMPGVIRNFDMR